jgi:hypothetical protein
VSYDVFTSTPNGADATEAVTGPELEAMALAADPTQPLPDDAVPYDRFIGSAPSLLPDWYMGPATRAHASSWRRPVVLAVVLAFLIIDGAGLCSTYGLITWA